jgi:hypothetical protein
MKSAPLRFLLAVLVLWVGVRAAILLPGLAGDIGPTPADAAVPGPGGTKAPIRIAASGDTLPGGGAARSEERRPAAPAPRQLSLAGPPEPVSDPPSPAAADLPAAQPRTAPKAALSLGPTALLALPALPATPGGSRWSASAWLLVRDESSGAALAPGGTLGGSQAGARVTYALGGGVALSGRFYLPLRRPAGAEAAAGVDWRPLPELPLNLLAERRQRLGREGRNGFALTLYGGASRNLAPRLRLDLYGQTGVVGLHARDLFADGSVRVSRRLGPIELGAGAWGAAQPGVARLDAGPSLSWRLPVPNSNLRLQADWRFRIAGDAMPHSGPALTVGADF